MLPQTYQRLTTQYGIGTEMGTGRTDHDTTQHPTTQWSKVQENLHAVRSSDELTAAWFVVIHDLLPTNDRLALQRSTASNCQHCGPVDSLIHRLTE